MKAQPRTTSPPIAPHRPGFTLVEILVVMVIIGILMAVAIPAITIAINRGKVVKMKAEVNSLVAAVKQYEQKYGDYPPDFSDWTVVQRHYKKIFPRISPVELLRLQVLLDVNPSNDTVLDANLASSVGAHGAARLDRGEVLSWVLGGYSDNPVFPFTGPGGPLEKIVDNGTVVVYQINSDRSNKLYDFQPDRLDLSQIAPGAAPSESNRYYSVIDSDPASMYWDLFPSYLATDLAPFVYFDSRTYTLFDTVIGDFNGYSDPTMLSVVRPYFSESANPNPLGTTNYPTLAAALNGWDFMNADTFQIIAPGLDGAFGSVPSLDFDASVAGAEPLYFQYKTGAAIVPSTQRNTPGDLLVPGVRGYQERSVLGAAENFQLDNIADFSNAQIVDDFEP